MKIKLSILALGVAFLFAAPSCRLYNLQRKLAPPYADFLSKVRYIITKEEKKIFLELPDNEKDNFIQEIWKRRDHDPYTEENEFKIEYFNRMGEADKLFATELKPGWLTDRGRIYILFGPPLDRITNPMGSSADERCNEVWYYGYFPVVFRDDTCTGVYKLVTYDLTELRDINLAYMHELGQAQERAQKTYSKEYKEKSLFDFHWRLRKTADSPERIEGVVTIAIPYDVIWFKEEAQVLTTTMDIRLELRDADGELYWEHKSSFEISLTEAELKEKKNASFTKEIPFTFEKDLERLRRGKSALRGLIKNLTGEQALRKVMEVSL